MNNSGINRTTELIKKLVFANTYISKYSMMESLYISESTLYQTVNEAKQKLKEFRVFHERKETKYEEKEFVASSGNGHDRYDSHDRTDGECPCRSNR